MQILEAIKAKTTQFKELEKQSSYAFSDANVINKTRGGEKHGTASNLGRRLPL